MSVTLREMTVDDIPAVHQLETELFPEDAWPVAAFESELAQNETRNYWVYENDGQIIGYAGLCTVLPISDVQTIAINPEFQGQGLGRKLLTLLVETAKQRNALDVMLEVRFDNPTAISLYESMGFITIHRRVGYYKGGVDALIMRLQLDAPQGQEEARKV
ncbi:ribosomal protein S18-alanine N-acetyltransferase [Arthrobacter sp. NIO-1057]|uniref:ribosomal protein S18-alanine N-acetyltransferase n=1 Tax=Arthrobacter sp. NIO-1057 TaxID=993071 RepID=UPI00071E4832|nr:ribosomal protein S18-alanine N-acetyltransferase [Arthrobacter sp. NIO-1057]KSU67187.1 ribosomal-protein-alanine acetyltransferase [Arthrobacter sp. NIO-1057]SCB99941.1 [SSU ribosomal protein S18P]-alanine acetyltransferase [Arthrobacter sp. NIO-1057]